MSDILFSSLQGRYGSQEDAKNRDTSIAKSIRASLFQKQENVLEDLNRLKAVLCPRRAGKSWTALSAVLVKCLENPGSSCVIVNLTLKAAKNTYWNSVLPRFLDTFGLQVNKHHTDMRITFTNGSIITFVGAETRAEIEKLRGGSYDYIVIDECKSYSPVLIRELIFDVCVPACSDRRGTVMLIGTPGSILDGPFYEATYPGATDDNGVPFSKTYDDPEAYWLKNPSTPLRWSRHSWSQKDNSKVPHLWDDNLALKASQGWADDHPTWLREYLGQWVAMDDAFVYAYASMLKAKPEMVTWEPDYSKEKHGLPSGHDWRFLLGLDLGFEDDFAMVVVAYSLTSTELYHVYDFKINHQDVYQVADHIAHGAQRLGVKFDAIVADAGGLGKMVVETLNRRHGFQIQAASKKDKFDHIELVNADFKAGRIKIQRGSDLEIELLQHQWDLTAGSKAQLAKTGRLREHSATPNHLNDALLYAWRFSYHTYGGSFHKGPEQGSEAWWADFQERMMEKTYQARENKLSLSAYEASLKQASRYGEVDYE